MFSGVPLSNSTVNYEIKNRISVGDIFGGILVEMIMKIQFWRCKNQRKRRIYYQNRVEKRRNVGRNQIDNYAINASVTDINGETQSANTNVKVASVSHYITANEIGNTFSDEDVKLNVDTKNYNDQILKKSYNVKLEKLEEPKQIFRKILLL
jgi:hypothetical protein